MKAEVVTKDVEIMVPKIETRRRVVLDLSEREASQLSHLLSEVIEDRGTFYADNVRTSEYGYGDTMRQIVKAINGTSIPMADVIDDDTYR